MVWGGEPEKIPRVSKLAREESTPKLTKNISEEAANRSESHEEQLKKRNKHGRDGQMTGGMRAAGQGERQKHGWTDRQARAKRWTDSESGRGSEKGVGDV